MSNSAAPDVKSSEDLFHDGNIVADFEFEPSADGWKNFAEKTAAWPNLAVSIETSQGAVVDQLLQHDYTVYPVHPVAAQRYRQRKAPTDPKTDHLDAWGLGDALPPPGLERHLLAICPLVS